MAKLSIHILGWNHDHETVRACIEAALAQEPPHGGVRGEIETVFTDNNSANGLYEFVRKEFAGRPNLRVLYNEQNLGYAGGHNKFITRSNSDFIMVLNPDAHLEPQFSANILDAFGDPAVAAATGKMLKPAEFGDRILDGTGIQVSRSRAGRERGQLKRDDGQFDAQPEVFGVSGTAAVFRRAALEAVKLEKTGGTYAETAGDEYFDEDFFAYWEDLDLSWRLRLQNFSCVYVPGAVVYHHRLAGQSTGGYRDVSGFIAHHKQLSTNVVRWNWRNHLFAIIKNDFGYALGRDLPRIVFREAAMFGYILLFEWRVLGALPDFFRLLPKIRAKRTVIQKRRKATSAQAASWFTGDGWL